MENRVKKTAVTLYFLAAAFLMYYFITQDLNVGLFVTYRHVFALIIAGSAVISFLYKPNIARGVTAAKSALVYSVPMFVTIVVSLFIWFAKQVDVSVISRGLSSSIVYMNMLSFALAAGAFLYIFGEKGIWYNLIAILASNLVMILTIILQNGIGTFISELITLIVTFAGNTGEVIVQAEIHELAFCLGAYLIYMILKPQKNAVFFVLFILTGFCFVAAFKRIGIIAIAISLFFGVLLKLAARLSERKTMHILTFLSAFLIFLLTAYIAAIKLGAFEYLEKAGVDTNGRSVIYSAVDKFYEFSPDFPGNGIGFLTFQLNSSMHIGVAAVHNDFLQYFIDLGFFGYLIWLTSMTVLRVRYFGSHGRTDNAITAFCLMLYLIIVSLTDNTMNYPLLTLVLAILMTGQDFDEKVRDTEIKIFGYVSEQNKIQNGGRLL